MVKPAEPRKRDDAARAWRLDRPRHWRVAVETHVRPVIIVISSVKAAQAKQVALPNHDDVIEQLAPQGSDKSFRASILPR